MELTYKKIKNVILLNKTGEIEYGSVKDIFSDSVFPVIAEPYIWDEQSQLKSAEKYKDNIKRVFNPEREPVQVQNMLKDDLRRMELIQKFVYGRRVLEVGCSDGSVSIKIAEKPEVSQVVGIDIRQSAINDGKKLLLRLKKEGKISQKTANKVKLVKLRIEDLPNKWPKFDSVCAYEVFEHMAPQDFLPAFQHLYRFIKPDGKFFISVPNRFPNPKYEKLGRSRWRWFDHRNFFSQLSLEMFLKNFFKNIKFYPLYKNETVAESIYLIAECNEKKY